MIPTNSSPLKSSHTKYGIFFIESNRRSFSFSTSTKFPLKTLGIKSFARITLIDLWVYRLNVLINTYLIFLPTVRAVLDGNVHGVVVQAKMYIWEYFLSLSGSVSSTHSNCAVTVVSVTSWYVPGWLSSWELKPVPALGEYGCILSVSYTHLTLPTTPYV